MNYMRATDFFFSFLRSVTCSLILEPFQTFGSNSPITFWWFWNCFRIFIWNPSGTENHSICWIWTVYVCCGLLSAGVLPAVRLCLPSQALSELSSYSKHLPVLKTSCSETSPSSQGNWLPATLKLVTQPALCFSGSFCKYLNVCFWISLPKQVILTKTSVHVVWPASLQLHSG